MQQGKRELNTGRKHRNKRVQKTLKVLWTQNWDRDRIKGSEVEYSESKHVGYATCSAETHLFPVDVIYSSLLLNSLVIISLFINFDYLFRRSWVEMHFWINFASQMIAWLKNAIKPQKRKGNPAPNAAELVHTYSSARRFAFDGGNLQLACNNGWILIEIFPRLSLCLVAWLKGKLFSRRFELVRSGGGQDVFVKERPASHAKACWIFQSKEDKSRSDRRRRNFEKPGQNGYSSNAFRSWRVRR